MTMQAHDLLQQIAMEFAAFNARTSERIAAFELAEKEQPATEPQATPILSTAGGFPQNEPSAPQEVEL